MGAQIDSRISQTVGRKNANNTTSPAGATRRWVGSLPWVLVLILCCLAWFTDKPFFIDDTLFVRVAQQIVKHPADFFGFKMNWGYSDEELIKFFYNPPLTSYYLAAVATVVGWSERALHWAFIIPALFAVWGTYSLADRFCRSPVLATLAACITPVFLVSATSLMSDVMFLGFWAWSLVWFERGLGSPGVSAFVVSGCLAGLAYLTKFPGLMLAPLLLAYGFCKRRRAGWWLAAPACLLLFAGGYEWLTHRLYGLGHLLQAADYSHEQTSQKNVLNSALVGMGFVGGCFLPLLFYSPLLWSRRVLLVMLFLVGPVTLLVAMPTGLGTFLRPGGTLNWTRTVQYFLFALAGTHLFLLALADVRERREPGSFVLLLWVAGVFVFATTMNWTVNARSFLPMAPALGILLARRAEARSADLGANGFRDYLRRLPRLWRWALPAVAGLVLCLLLMNADRNVAREDRAAAIELYAKYQKPGREVWFEGHWGFQYYMEQLGARPLDMVHPQIKPGDVLVIPNSAPNVSRPDKNVATLIDAVSYLPNRYYSTMNPSIGAAFYSAARGSLPFAAGPIKPDYYLVFTPTGR